MKLSYKGRVSKRTGETVYRQTGRTKFCCARLCELWNGEPVGFGFGVPGHRVTTCRDVSLWVKIPQAGGRTCWALTPIAFCPFCGVAVEACREK
jgi:hypothetical protein